MIFAVVFMVVILLVIVVAVTAIAQPPNRWVHWFTGRKDDRDS